MCVARSRVRWPTGRGVSRADIVTLEPALLDLDELQASAPPAPRAGLAPEAPPAPAALAPTTLRDALDACQRQSIASALAQHEGNWARAARQLDIDASNLHKLARRLGLKG